MPQKHVPLRTCVACRQVRPKREMVRIVRPPEGGLTIDERGKAAGRGAYICRSRRCWVLGIQGGRLEHGLRTTLGEQERQMLQAYSASLPEDTAENKEE
jgi:uncharacterized protein